MQELRVGKLWNGKILSYDSPVFEMDKSGIAVYLFFADPSAKEIEGCKTGKLQMGYYVRGSVIFVALKIAGMGGWMDMPFNVHLYDGKRDYPELPDNLHEGIGETVTLVLIDRRTALIKALRVIGASTGFTIGLHMEIQKQINARFDQYSYDAEIRDAYKSLTSDDIAARAENTFTIRRDNE